MFEKVGQIAEQLAMNVSRRRFLGRLGRAALAAAAAGGILTMPHAAEAGSNQYCHRLCRTNCGNHRDCFDSCYAACIRNN
jgi:hypothetical protein